MATAWDCLSIQSKRNLARYSRKRLGVFFKPPGSKKRAIEVQGKLESLEEIDRLIRKAPGYSIDVQGREG